ncbi:MAG: fibronectin type III domain-containing protein, partial [Oscillospiraceae bacterium]
KTYYGKTSSFLYAAALAPASFKSSYTSTTTTAAVSWSKVSGATGYRIYKYDTSTKAWKQVKTITGADATSATVTGLTSGTTTKLKVNAYLTKGTKTYVGKAGTMINVTTKK